MNTASAKRDMEGNRISVNYIIGVSEHYRNTT